MVLQAHLKKHVITLGVWFFMYPRRPPRPPVWQKTRLFPDFFFATFPNDSWSVWCNVHLKIFPRGHVLELYLVAKYNTSHTWYSGKVWWI